MLDSRWRTRRASAQGPPKHGAWTWARTHTGHVHSMEWRSQGDGGGFAINCAPGVGESRGTERPALAAFAQCTPWETTRRARLPRRGLASSACHGAALIPAAPLSGCGAGLARLGAYLSRGASPRPAALVVELACREDKCTGCKQPCMALGNRPENTMERKRRKHFS